MTAANKRAPGSTINSEKHHNDETKTNARNDAQQKMEQAHQEAEKDIKQDPDLSIHSPNDDLDEAETARLGEDKTDLV